MASVLKSSYGILAPGINSTTEQISHKESISLKLIPGFLKSFNIRVQILIESTLFAESRFSDSVQTRIAMTKIWRVENFKHNFLLLKNFCLAHYDNKSSRCTLSSPCPPQRTHSQGFYRNAIPIFFYSRSFFRGCTRKLPPFCFLLELNKRGQVTISKIVA